jgi:flagellum-specific peptidoglycan hydrolase FlgJ
VRAPVSETQAQQAFISEVAPGAVAAQRRYGVPAAVTIAQAIDESGWGQSELASQDHNLFGIKGTGPAGSVPLPTQEYVNGQPVNTSASFRVYNNVAESIDDHGRLLARSGY